MVCKYVFVSAECIDALISMHIHFPPAQISSAQFGKHVRNEFGFFLYFWMVSLFSHFVFILIMLVFYSFTITKKKDFVSLILCIWVLSKLNFNICILVYASRFSRDINIWRCWSVGCMQTLRLLYKLACSSSNGSVDALFSSYLIYSVFAHFSLFSSL